MNTLTSITFNNTANYAFSVEVLGKIPYFDDVVNATINNGSNTALTGINVACPFKVNCIHLILLNKIMKPQKVVAGVDAKSHKLVFGVMQLAKFLGIPTDVINAGFGLWTSGSEWINMRGVGYIYAIYAENDYLCDINKFFREYAMPMQALTQGLKRKAVRNNATEYLAILAFFETIDFVNCFNANNDAIQDRINMLNNMRLDAWSEFLVNPHSALMAPLMNYTPSFEKVWACKDITVMPAYKIDEPVIVGLDTMLMRFKEFTHSIFEKPLNKSVITPFPFANVVFAGGSITKMLSSNYDIRKCKQSDIDIFVIGKTNQEQSRIVDQVLTWFDTTGDLTMPQSYFAINGSVTTVYICGINRKFQVISMNSTNPHKIIGRFDFAHVQWCIYNGKVLGTAASCNAIRTQTTRVVNAARMKLIRVIKAFHCGYDVVCNEIISNVCGNIDILLQTPKSTTMTTLLAELYVWYYPVSDPSSTHEEEKAHILCQINKDGNYRLITGDFSSVLENVTIGGNFDMGYEDNLYTTFNANNIVNCVAGRYINFRDVQTKKGVMRLQTAALTLVSVEYCDDDIILGVTTKEPKFIDFCNNLDTNIFRMYKGTTVVKNLVNNGIITFTVRSSTMLMQTAYGISMLRTYKGQPLDIEEDLHIGDEIVILFSITMILDTNNKSVVLSAKKIMKKGDPPVQLAIEPATYSSPVSGNDIAYERD